MVLAALSTYILSSVKDREKAVPVEEFGGHVQRMHDDRDKWFELEYEVSEQSGTALSFLWCLISCLCRLKATKGYTKISFLVIVVVIEAGCPLPDVDDVAKHPQHQHKQTRNTEKDIRV